MKAFIYLLSAIVATTLVVVSHGQEDIAKTYLTRHNEARAEVGVPPLKWSETLAKSAQEFADTKVKPTCDFMLTSNGPYGVNIGYAVTSANDAVNQWLYEKKNYDFNTNSCLNNAKVCEHYKQVVWKDSVYLGCYDFTCNGWDVFLCQYDPAGNINGVKPY